MIKTVKLLNFRKHVDRTLNLTKGLNILKGANEAGKSTVLEAVLYAWFGTSALRESLADTVTWGQPESALKVEVTFDFDGVEYTATRSKSGAVLRYGDQVVTGQKETRQFMERLLGAGSDTAATLLFADQNAIRGILSQGATAAGSLVEKLADLAVIEQLVDKVQTQLLSGNTTAIQQQIDTLTAASSVELAAPLSDDLDAAKLVVANCQQIHGVAAIDLEAAAPAAQAATLVIEAVSAQVTRAAVQATERRNVETRAAVVLVAPELTPERIQEIETAKAGAVEAGFRLAAYRTVFPKAEVEWDESPEAFEARLTALPALARDIGQRMHTLELEMGKVAAKAITDSTCAFCQKDLTDVPEVLATNLVVNSKLEEIRAELAKLKAEQGELNDEYLDMKGLDNVCRKITTLANSRYWKLSATVPPVPEWIGEVPIESAPINIDTKAARAAWEQYIRALTVKQTAEEYLKNLEIVKVDDDTEAKATVQKYRELDAALKDAEKELRIANNLLNIQEVHYARAESAYAAKVEARGAAAIQLQTAKATLETTDANNALIKKLRNARGPIATKLWTTTMHAVSHHFSEIRGTVSTVTREADGFKVDGHGTAGLSGSTLDALGLAIRLALSKLFLPNVPFLFLDEAAAGCDDTRELAMLGTIASSGFEQILLVTHSELGDALANNLVVL